jgi:hypothetical protein
MKTVDIKESRTESPVPSSRLADLAARIKVEHAACVAAVKKSAEHAMAAGDALTEAKAQLKHGEWLPWLKSHCEISERTAQVYMRLARKRAEIETNPQHAADLSLRAAEAWLAPPDGDDGTDKNEWYTPEDWIKRARAVMGTIDLDPASCEFAQRTVQATEWFDQERDGLAHPWRGSVFLNPPYSERLIKPFIDKLVAERENFSQAIVLVHSLTDAAWFHDLCSIANAIAFTKRRIYFYNKDGKQPAPRYGSALIYIGDPPEDFAKAFRDDCLVLPCGDRRPSNAAALRAAA